MQIFLDLPEAPCEERKHGNTFLCNEKGHVAMAVTVVRSSFHSNVVCYCEQGIAASYYLP